MQQPLKTGPLPEQGGPVALGIQAIQRPGMNKRTGFIVRRLRSPEKIAVIVKWFLLPRPYRRSDNQSTNRAHSANRPVSGLFPPSRKSDWSDIRVQNVQSQPFRLRDIGKS